MEDYIFVSYDLFECNFSCDEREKRKAQRISDKFGLVSTDTHDEDFDKA